jgi:hypothetical protein
MIVLLIVHINLQHLRDRTTLLPTLLSLGDWIRALAAEPRPVRVGRITVPEWIDSRQKSNAVKVIREKFDGAGHLAFRSSSNLVFYQRITGDDAERQPHLALQTTTGGAANRAEIIPAATENGAVALDRIITRGWLQPIGDDLSNSPDVLAAQFFAIFPDGVIVDLETRAGRWAARALQQGLLVGLLPAAMKSLDQGAVVASVSNRWVTPVFYGGKLRLIFVLPAELDTDRLRRWRRTVNTWNACGDAPDVSHVRSG